ncbi:MAG: MotA/TolQ/ExbB proton channel family protein [Planctomycetes bacterium]|nr:MotA/TolQ/ExbB proton channel family protein [Planctomycetota bacterium]
MISNEIVQSLVQSTQWLITPIYWVLLIGVLWLAFQAGQTLRDAVYRWRSSVAWNAYMKSLRVSQTTPSKWNEVAYSNLQLWVRQRAADCSDLELVLVEAESWAQRRLSRFQVWIRTGPMFGLIGTLVPLGPALQGLAQSNLDDLSSNLSVAFTTTIIGIGIGAVAYWLFIIQRAWFEKDLIELEFVASRAKQLG